MQFFTAIPIAVRKYLIAVIMTAILFPTWIVLSSFGNRVILDTIPFWNLTVIRAIVLAIVIWKENIFQSKTFSAIIGLGLIIVALMGCTDTTYTVKALRNVDFIFGGPM
ncbi:MAG: hypothetical protein Q8Q94_01575 [bacterium]|nr:hypothetical protein [bacterium]